MNWNEKCYLKKFVAWLNQQDSVEFRIKKILREFDGLVRRVVSNNWGFSQNNYLQNKVKFIIPEVRISEKVWSKCGKLMGGSKTKIDEIQVRNFFQDKQTTNS